MNGRFWLPAVGSLILCACSPRTTVPDGSRVLDEDVTLSRQADQPIDSATREFPVDDDTILVAIVDENLTDVQLEFATVDSEVDAPKPVKVENHMNGSGVEVALFQIADGARVRVTLTSAQDSVQPGTVHLQVRQFSAGAARDQEFASQVGAFRAWSAATDASFRVDAVEKTGLPEIQKAIDGLGAAQGDAALAAHARLIKARMLSLVRTDRGEARAEAQRAAAAFAGLPKPDALNEARAKYLEALALTEISHDRESKEPTADEAKKLARDLLEQMSASASVLGPIERARAITALARLDIHMMLAVDANQKFEQARAIYQENG
ncbi:MAG TPA: hypothetical protein VFS58_04835, partial [Steroidobacteraceae bacterium]|nr:hypothetical protein [Steroidobacteraceae bacterium]